MDNKEFGKFINNLRREKGLTQAELADRLNVTDKTVSKWECGRGFPDIKLIEVLADNLDVSVTEIMKCDRAHDEKDGEKGTDWLHKSLIDNLIYVSQNFKIYRKRILLTPLLVFCLLGTLLSGYTNIFIFEFLDNGGFISNFLLYEILIGIAIWHIFVKDENNALYQGQISPKYFGVKMAIVASCILNLTVMLTLTNLYRHMFTKTLNRELFRGMNPWEIGPYAVNRAYLSIAILIVLGGLCFYFGKRYSKYLTIAAMQHVAGIYSLLKFRNILRSLDLQPFGGGDLMEEIFFACRNVYIGGILIMGLMMGFYCLQQWKKAKLKTE